MAEPERGDDKQPHGGDGEEPRTGRTWVDVAVKIAPYFFLKPVKVRWQLENWRRRRAQARRRREHKLDHIRYQHKTCSACGAVQDRDATVCTRCGEKLGRRGFQVLQRLGVFAPEWVSMSSFLGVVLVLAFVRVVAASPGGAGDLFNLKAYVLYLYGGNVAGAVAAGEPWRLLTACFLHGGLLHIGFNLFALSVVGPQVESLYGRTTMLFFFVLTGALAFLGSGLAAGPEYVGIGASGGIMGLVGVAAGWGQRQGTGAGRQVRNDMLKWAAYTIVFGLFIGADNWAHVFGLATGFACGMSIQPQIWRRPALAGLRGLAGLLAVAATIAAIVLIARPPAITAQRELDAARRDWDAAWNDICRMQAAGDTDGAMARVAPLLPELRKMNNLDSSAQISPQGIAGLCARMKRE
jgi:rhomboid protease GluP